MMKKLLLVLMVLLASTGVARAQYTHAVTGTAITLTCTGTAAAAYTTDVFTQTLTGNTTYTLPGTAAGCAMRDHVELLVTQGTNQAFTATVVAGAGTALTYPYNGGVRAIPASTGGATNITLHQIWVYDTAPGTPTWELVTQETNPAQNVVSACSLAGATADVQINAANTVLNNGGTIDARCYGATNQTIAAPVTLGAASHPVALWVDNATTWTCTITTGSSVACWNVGAGGSITGQSGGGSAGGFTLSSTANVMAIITNATAGGVGFTLENISAGGGNGATVAKGDIYLNAPLNQVTLRNLTMGGTNNAKLIYIDNAGGSAIGPVHIMDSNIDCNGNVGCQPLKMTAVTNNYFGSISITGGYFNHPGSASLPMIELDSSATNEPISVSIRHVLMESFNNGDIGIQINGCSGCSVDDVVTSSANANTATAAIQLNNGSNFIENFTASNIRLTNNWTNLLQNTANGETIAATSAYQLGHYYYSNKVNMGSYWSDNSGNRTSIYGIGVKLPPVNLSACPACSATTEGQLCEVNNDAAACGFGTTVTTGGTHHVLAQCNGTNYVMATCQ